MSELFGHPCMNPFDGFNNTIFKIRNQFVRMFRKSYFNKEHWWSKIKMSLCTNKLIRTAYVENRWFTEKEISSLNLMEWSSIHFDKTFEYDYTPDTSELIKDTSIAPGLGNWYQSDDHSPFVNKWGKTLANI